MVRKLKKGEIVVIRSDNSIVLGNDSGVKITLDKDKFGSMTDEQLIQLLDNKSFNVVNRGGSDE